MQVSSTQPRRWLGRSNNPNSWELGRILNKVGLQYSICEANSYGFPEPHLESLGAAEVQVFVSGYSYKTCFGHQLAQLRGWTTISALSMKET